MSLRTENSTAPFAGIVSEYANRASTTPPVWARNLIASLDEALFGGLVAKADAVDLASKFAASYLRENHPDYVLVANLLSGVIPALHGHIKPPLERTERVRTELLAWIQANRATIRSGGEASFIRFAK